MHLLIRTLFVLSLALFLGFAATASAQTAPYVDANGWTVFTESLPSGEGSGFTGNGTRKIYVSSSLGNDTNPGTQAAPVKTLAKGKSLFRFGYPDWLLLKKGDTWTNEGFGWAPSGRSASEPGLISSYGTGARPLLKTNNTPNILGIWGSTPDQNLAVIGLEFYEYVRDPANPSFNPAAENAVTPIGLIGGSSFLLFEDNKISFYGGAITLMGASGATDEHKDIRIRRNIIVNQYSNDPAKFSSGMFITDQRGLLIEGNLFDHNGWNENVAGAIPTVFNHNIYINGVNEPRGYINGPATIRGNIFANDASGSQFRTGGIVSDNLFVRNPYPHSFGRPSAYASSIKDNVYTEAIDRPGIASGWGPGTMAFFHGYPYDVGTVAIYDNILAHSANPNGNGIAVDEGPGDSITNNIVWDWGGDLIRSGAGVTVTGNVEHSSNVNDVGYLDPFRTVGSYNASLGGPATTAAFLAEARKQSKDNWRSQYTANAVNNYVRAGFTGGSTPPPAPVTPLPTATLSASPTSITAGSSATLTWSSTNATSCTGTGFTPSGTSGSVTVSPSVTTSYSVICTGAGGSAGASASVTATAAVAAPAVVINSTPAQGLIGRWTFDEGSGTTATDSSGNGNTGALVNSPTTDVAGKIGQAFTFDGLNDYVNIGNSSTYYFSGTQPFTTSVWFYPTNTSGTKVLVGRYNLGVLGNWAFYVSDGKLRGCREISPWCIAANTITTANTWNHGVFVYDGTNMRLFLNGISDAASIASGNITANQSNLELLVGAWKSFNSPAGFFNGKLDDVRIYDRALSAQEVTDLYQSATAVAPVVPAVTPAPTPAPVPTPTPSQSVPSVGGGGGAASTNAVSSDSTTPSTPTGLVVAASSPSQVKLTWSASTDNTGVVGYRIYRNGTYVDTALFTSSADTGLSPNTTYRYTIAAYDSEFNLSEPSAPVSITTPAFVSASAPSPAASVAVGTTIKTTSRLNVRSNPTIASKNVLCIQPSGTTGAVVEGPVIANGYTWWKVKNNTSCDGWAVAQYLAPSNTTPTITPQVGSRIQTTDKLSVRSEATNRFRNVLCIQPAGTLGTIVGGPTTVGGYTWWNINYDQSCDGWSVQDYLTVVPVTTALPVLEVAEATAKTDYAGMMAAAVMAPFNLLVDALTDLFIYAGVGEW